MAKKEKFRFYVGKKSERYSSVYSVTVHNGNVYLVSKGLGGIAKASFHKGGVCHFGFTKEFWEKNHSGHRHLFCRWRRPITIAPNRFAPIAFIRFQNNLLKARTPIEIDSAVCVVAPQINQILEVAMVIASSCAEGTEAAFQNHTLLWKQDISENEKLLVLTEVRTEDLSCDDVISKLNSPGQWHESKKLTELRSGETIENLNATLGTKPEDGKPIILTEVTGVRFTKR